MRRVRQRGGRQRPTGIFSTALSLWQFVDSCIWMKMGMQIKILFRKGIGIKRVEYLSKDTDMVRRDREREKDEDRGGGTFGEKWKKG